MTKPVTDVTEPLTLLNPLAKPGLKIYVRLAVGWVKGVIVEPTLKGAIVSLPAWPDDPAEEIEAQWLSVRNEGSR